MYENRDTITTMGELSQKVYNDEKGVNYFQVGKTFKANNHTYKVLDNTPASDQGFNALLLQDIVTGKYVIAFRGTQEKFDILDDVIIGLNNFSAEYHAAKAWVDKVLATKDKGYDVTPQNLTLTGHSLEGMLIEKSAPEYITIKNFNFHSVVDNAVCRRGRAA